MKTTLCLFASFPFFCYTAQQSIDNGFSVHHELRYLVDAGLTPSM